MSNPYRPDLPEDTLWLERAVVVGDCISQMLFGIVFYVSAQATHTLITKPPRGQSRQWALIAYTCLLFILAGVFVSMDLRSLQLSHIDNRNFPGGPTAYSLSEYGKPITVIPNACAIVGDWLAAGFLLYRCLVIFHLTFYIVAIPILMYLGSIAMGCLVLFHAGQPHAHLWTQSTVNFGVPYFSLSVALNILITVMISIRLFIYRRAMKRTLGASTGFGQVTTNNLGIPYASIAAMLIESSALYAVASILFIAPYSTGSHVSNIFLPNMVMCQFLAPLLIILRVAQRRAWDERTATALQTALDFHGAQSHSADSDVGGPTEMLEAAHKIQLGGGLRFKPSDDSFAMDSSTSNPQRLERIA